MTEFQFRYPFSFTEIAVLQLALDYCWMTRDRRSLVMHDDNQQVVFEKMTSMGFSGPDIVVDADWLQDNGDIEAWALRGEERQ